MGTRALFIIVAEALALVAIAYHSLALAGKTLPTIARQIFLHIPIAKVQQLGRKMPEWAALNRLKSDHATSLLHASASVLLAPIALLSPSFSLDLPSLHTNLMPSSYPQRMNGSGSVSAIWDRFKRNFASSGHIKLMILASTVVISWMVISRMLAGPERSVWKRLLDKADCEEPNIVSIKDDDGYCRNFRTQKACEQHGGVWNNWEDNGCSPKRDYEQCEQSGGTVNNPWLRTHHKQC